MANREIEARLKISAIDRTGKVLTSLGNRLENVSKRVDGLNRHMTTLSKFGNMALGYFAVDRLAGGVKDAVVDFAALERQMTRIGITAGATKDETAVALQDVQKEAKNLAMPLDQAVAALDTLVSSGMDLKQAMAFLPSVLATAQASGAQTTDIANTAIKTTSALELQAGQMQHAFDIMVEGGKAGQFELKDMAAYIPDLANSFASLGYKGEDGLKKLIALMQTVREDTGTSEAAATNLQNVFGKIYSQDTASKFKKMGIDLNAELAKARKNGEDTVAAFVRISKEAVKGDLTKLPLLFTDQQFRLGMQSLMTSQESYEKFLKTVNDTKVDGTVFRDLNRVLGDTQSSIDKMSASWSTMKLKLGGVISAPASSAMDAVSDSVDRGEAVTAALKKRGYSDMQISLMMIGNDEADRLAREGGYVPPGRDDLKRLQKEAPDAYKVLGRYPEQPHMTAEARGAQALDDFYGDHVDINVMRQHIARRKALLLKSKLPEIERFDAERDRMQRARDQEAGEAMSALDGGFSLRHALSMDTDKYGGSLFRRRRQTVDPMQSTFPARPEVVGFHERQTADEAFRGGPGFRAQYVSQGDNAQLADAAAEKLKQGADEGGQKLSEGGSEAGRQLIAAAQEMGRILSSAAADLKTQLANLKVNVNPVGVAPAKVNANTGRTNTFANAPASLGHQ